jgi:hypothetical protein
MSEGRLSSSIEAGALVRRAQAEGGFAAILHKGDADRGALLLVIRERGGYVACLERTLGFDGRYAWQRTGPGRDDAAEMLADFLERRVRFDSDSWLIELDIAQPERFIAETTSAP